MIVLDTEIARLQQAGVSMAQLVVLLALMKNDLALQALGPNPMMKITDPQPLTLVTLSRALKMPLSTVSRVLWEIIDTHQLASYGTSTDRRKKPIVFDRHAYEKLVGLKGGIDR